MLEGRSRVRKIAVSCSAGSTQKKVLAAPSPRPARPGLDRTLLTTGSSFRATMEEYFAAVHGLAGQVTHAVATALELPEDYFDAWFTTPMVIMSPLHYPPQKTSRGQEIDESRIGAGAHSDYGCLALLAQDDKGGLQVRRTAGRWIGGEILASAVTVEQSGTDRAEPVGRKRVKGRQELVEVYRIRWVDPPTAQQPGETANAGDVEVDAVLDESSRPRSVPMLSVRRATDGPAGR